jgi:hypothetical protein
MAVKLVPGSGATHIKSQEELDRVFNRVQAAAHKQRSADAQHALDVYNKVVADGKHVKEFASNPASAADKLGLKLTPAQVSRIQAATSVAGGGAAADTVELVAVAIIVLVLADVPDRELVIDTAGVIKV